ncbi:MAG: formylglycine-generating enzyme family protein [Phycisphaerae bacterium]
MALQIFTRKPTARPSRRKAPRPVPSTQRETFVPAPATELAPDPVRQCLDLERFGFLLARRADWKDHPEIEDACRTAREAVDERFAIVPEGFVTFPKTVRDFPGCEEETMETEAFLLARHAVTNAQFQKFVDAGGYQDLELWPKDIWPHLIDFRDATEEPGPKFWRLGRHNARLSDHPVVGICYYEAAAYARWAGFRLPTEAQWQMAATWRIRSEANVLRRYPWGDALDTTRCNIWSSGFGKTVPVDAYPNGVAPNQVCQLVGNVWEWTDGLFEVTDEDGGVILGDMRLSSIRGGAFDTYFPAQATSEFRTGLVSMARVHNVGFRCAMDLGGEGA